MDLLALTPLLACAFETSETSARMEFLPPQLVDPELCEKLLPTVSLGNEGGLLGAS